MNKIYHKRRTINSVKRLKQVDYSTLLVLQAAEQCNVKWEKLLYTPAFKLTHKGTTKYFRHQVPSETTSFAEYCCKQKRITNNLLMQAGISISKSYMIRPADSKKYKLELYEHMVKPLVVKPNNSMQGNNVSLNITTKTAYIKAIKDIYEFNGDRQVSILVEEMFQGAQEYRILATPEKILSVIKRVPANVVGDGTSTIRQLITVKNKHPLRKQVETYATIDINQHMKQHLEEQGLNLNSILPIGQKVNIFPQSPFNISIGGDTVDVTDQIHPSVVDIVKKIMTAIPGLSLAGIDYMTKDIHGPQTSQNYRVIEVNNSPSLDWNQYPLIGPERPIGFEFLKIMFPDLQAPDTH